MVVMTVVRLGAWCDYSAESADQDGRSAAFDVHEFAVLADGRRMTLHTERGFSLSGGDDPWRYITLESLERDVRTTVLPDDDAPGDEHPWEWLAELVRAHGISMFPAGVARRVADHDRVADLGKLPPEFALV